MSINFISYAYQCHMDTAEIHGLAHSGESLLLEFKRRRKPNDFTDNDLIEAFACLANGKGGTLLIGVEDNGSITGCHPWHGEATDPYRLQALVQNRTRPSLATEIGVVDVDGLDVVYVKIPDSEMPIGTTRGVYQRRALKTDGTPQCIAYEPHDLMLSQFSASGPDWAQLPAINATRADTEPSEFDRFRRMCTAANGDRALAELDDSEILRALGLLSQTEPETVSLGAILLFGKESSIRRWIPNHEVTFQVLDHTRLLTNDFLTTPLFKVAEQLQERLEARNIEEEMPWGLLRLALPRIPSSVAREAIANALVHRDYTALGSISVSLTEETFSVRSPGGFPRGITQDNLLVASQARSRTLADAFKRAGLVERSGRGVAIMYRDLLSLGRNEPDYSQTTEQDVVVLVPLESADKLLVGYLRELQEKGTMLSLTELRVLHLLRSDGALSITDLVSDLRTAAPQLRPVLNRMAEQGLVEIRGTGRQREFHLSSGFYDSANRRSEYVRSAPVDAIRREEMILKYVREYGRITRQEAADLCDMTPAQASILLRSMARSGSVELRGERRGSHYVQPAAGSKTKE